MLDKSGDFAYTYFMEVYAMFKRKIYDKLLEWKNNSNGATALLIEGARRIGKSTVVEHFGKNEYSSYILIDFATCSPEIKNLFNDISDLNFFFLQLQLYCHVDLFERNSLIIFDEVQLFPKARQSIKYLVKDGRYDYIETGSLISIKKNVENILIPSEERKLSMHPMDYEEFLWAIGDNTTTNKVREFWNRNISFGDDLNRKLMRSFRLYMLIGGMPQAVDAYLETNNFSEVDKVKRDILTLYEDDFYKIDSTGRISTLFDEIPSELNKNSMRYQVSSVLKNERYDTIQEFISELVDSKTVNIAYHANDINAGLSSAKDFSIFKLFLSDTGLFTTLIFKDKSFTENIIYEKVLSNKLPANLGYLYENVVAQMLAAKGDKLYYHTVKSKTSNHNYEVDFIIAREDKICPIEVKSSNYKAHKSLDVFSEKYSSKILRKYLVYSKDMRKDKDINMIPFYIVPFL